MPFSHHDFDSSKICLQLEAMDSNSKSETTTVIGTEEENSGSEFDPYDTRREKAFELVLTSLGRKKRMNDGGSGLDQITPSASFREKKANGSFPNAFPLTPKSVDSHLPWNELRSQLNRNEFESQSDESTIFGLALASSIPMAKSTVNESNLFFGHALSIQNAFEDQEEDTTTNENPNLDLLLLDTYTCFLDAVLDEIEADGGINGAYRECHRQIAQDVADDNIIPWILPFINTSTLTVEDGNGEVTNSED